MVKGEIARYIVVAEDCFTASEFKVRSAEDELLRADCWPLTDEVLSGKCCPLPVARCPPTYMLHPLPRTGEGRVRAARARAQARGAGRYPGLWERARPSTRWPRGWAPKLKVLTAVRAAVCSTSLIARLNACATPSRVAARYLSVTRTGMVPVPVVRSASALPMTAPIAAALSVTTCA